MVPCRAACGDRSVEQLLTSGGVWQADAERTRALQCEVQVLLMQRDAETGLEIALDHAFAVHLKDAGRSESSHQRLPHTGGIGASLGGENQRLADRLDRQGDNDLVRDLGRLSVAVAADKRDVLAHEREDRLDLLEGRLGPADHNRETRRLGADLAAGYRRVEIFAAKGTHLLGEVLCGDRRDRAHVDDDLALRKPLRDTSGAKQHRLDVRRIRDHGDDNVRLLAYFLSIGASDRALVDELLQRRAAGMNEKLMTAFQEVGGHRAPHDAETDETDLCHVLRLQRGEIMVSAMTSTTRRS